MPEYIDREAAYRFAQDQLKKETGAYSRGWNHAMNVMKSAFHNNDAIPAADVVPVQHARWIVTAEFSDCVYAQCDQCKIQQVFYYNKPLTNYCPNCGALMDKDGDENDNS